MEKARPPREGDVHRVLTVAGYRFVIRYGYYTVADRKSGALCPIYPDFKSGRPLATALRDACAHYLPKSARGDGWCAGCAHYADERADIATCYCAALRGRVWDKRRQEGGNR